jgi:pimeloyl-[acyl-carrier protein] methyl ester esterase
LRSTANIWVFLPGLDGTGLLFDPLRPYIPSGIEAIFITYPVTGSATADELIQKITSSLPKEDDFILVAESFSGPLGIRVAAAFVGRVRCLVLCASFCASPMPKLLLWIFSFTAPALVNIGLSDCLIRFLLIDERSKALLPLIRSALEMLSARALASRFMVLGEFDDLFAPQALSVPILYLRAIHDRLVTKRHAKSILQRYPQSVIQELNSPHLILQCNGEDAAMAISSFAANIASE